MAVVKKTVFFIWLLLIPLYASPAAMAIKTEPTTYIYRDNQSETIIRTQTNISTSDYDITDFKSAITINQDTSLTVKETIAVNFNIPKHGIFRLIPYLYSDGKRQINSRLKVQEVLVDNKPANYETSTVNQSKQVKIGSANLTITGQHEYQITYRVNNILQRYNDHDELYWNVTGHEWDTVIDRAGVTIESPFAQVRKHDCFTGRVGSSEKNCQVSASLTMEIKQSLGYHATKPLNPGDDFTVVIGLDKNNQLGFPGPIELLIQKVLFYFSLIVLIVPSLFAFYVWYKKGRDQRYQSDNLYINQPGQPTRAVGVFERKYLPLAYQPIKGLSPAQAGTIIDEKVDIQDVVSEIIELARLGFLTIERKVEKKFLGNSTEYHFTQKTKDTDKLYPHQSYLLEKLFDKGKQVKLSELKNTFYQHLASFKTKLYENMQEAKYFNGNPKKVQGIWFLKFFLVGIGCFVLSGIISGATGNLISLAFLPVTVPINILVMVLAAIKMPRRTALGYSYYRQLEGLRYFITKGKWREEISEKNLFLEEILPLAICLGVVTKLAKDMQDLNLPPPDYLSSIGTTNFASAFSDFSRQTGSIMISSPSGKWSGSSSWSGGSGFGGGGSSGGGFGGGGGGSW